MENNKTNPETAQNTSAILSDKKSNPSSPLALIIFIFILGSYASIFHPDPVDNVMNRVDALYAIVYDRTLHTDRYASNTIDKALYRGHYYYSQAIGTLPPAAAILATYKYLSRDQKPDPYKPLPLYLITLLIVSLPSALLSALLFKWLSGFTQDTITPLAVTLAFAFGTLILPYSTLYYNYIPAILLCFIAFLHVENSIKHNSFTPSRLATTGLLLSLAAVTQYDTAIIGLCLAIYALCHMKNKSRVLYIALGAVPPLLLLAAYNNACFGNPFTLGLSHLETSSDPRYANLVKTGSLGLTTPSPRVLLTLLLQPGRGILWLSPFLIFSVPGFIAFAKQKETKATAWLFISISMLYLLYNSSFVGYNGGAAPGPRYLTPAMLFLCAPAIFTLEKCKPLWKTTYITLAAAALCLALVTLVGPHIPANITSPFFSVALPMTLRNPPLWTAKTAGQLIGLRGLPSLIPYALFATACAIIFFKTANRLKATPLKAAQPFARLRASAIILPLALTAAFLYAGYILSDINTPTAISYRGDVFLAEKQYANAEQEFTRAINLPGGSAYALSGRALTRSALGNANGAIQDLLAILKTSPRDAAARAAYAQILNQNKHNLPAAATQYEILLSNNRASLTPEITYQARITIARNHQAKGQHQQALKHLTAAANMQPNSAAPLALIANTQIALYNQTHDKQHLAAAAVALEKQIRIEPNSVPPRETLAAVAIQLGNAKTAALIARDILLLDPNNVIAKKILQNATNR